MTTDSFAERGRLYIIAGSQVGRPGRGVILAHQDWPAPVEAPLPDIFGKRERDLEGSLTTQKHNSREHQNSARKNATSFLPFHK